MGHSAMELFEGKSMAGLSVYIHYKHSQWAHAANMSRYQQISDLGTWD